MKGLNFKEYEAHTVTPQNFTTYNEIRNALGRVGSHPIDMLAICDNDTPNKYLVSYLVTKCRSVFSHELMSVYYSKSIGYLVYDKLTNVIFLHKDYFDTIDNIPGNLSYPGSSKTFFNALP